MNANLQELDIACRVNRVPRTLFDARAKSGDVPAVSVMAGRVVVDAMEFRHWAVRVRAEEQRGCEECE